MLPKPPRIMLIGAALLLLLGIAAVVVFVAGRLGESKLFREDEVLLFARGGIIVRPIHIPLGDDKGRLLYFDHRQNTLLLLCEGQGEEASLAWQESIDRASIPYEGTLCVDETAEVVKVLIGTKHESDIPLARIVQNSCLFFCYSTGNVRSVKIAAGESSRLYELIDGNYTASGRAEEDIVAVLQSEGIAVSGCCQ